MIRYFLFTLLAFPFAALSQEEDTGSFYNWIMQDSSEHYVFGDTVYVRSGPGLTAPVLDTLFAGDEISLISKTKIASTIKGIAAPWVNVQYKKGGQAKKGIIWSGLLSFTPMRRGSTKFVFGIENKSSKIQDKQKVNVYRPMLKVVQSGKILDKTSFSINEDESTAFIGGELTPGGGLDSIKYVVSLVFSGEACGIPAYTYPFAWDGRKLIGMPLLTEVADADIYYHTENFIFPGDRKGKKGMLIVNIETGESTEKTDKKGDLIYKKEREQHLYSWDRTKFTLIKKIKT